MLFGIRKGVNLIPENRKIQQLIIGIPAVVFSLMRMRLDPVIKRINCRCELRDDETRCR